MKYLEEKTSNVSILVENQFPDFVKETNGKFLNFVSKYYESQESKYQPLDVVSNLVDYYNIGYYRYDKLIKSTKLSSPLDIGNDLVVGGVDTGLKTTSAITVDNTIGFPDKNGYIKIDSEIIYYKSKTSTQFLNCTRGTKALVLNSVPKSEVSLVNSVPSTHITGSVVENIAFGFANEFLQRIKSELAPSIPEVLDESLDLSNFIKNIKSFYSAKGSLNSHRILFKILFNDRKFNIKFKPRGSGAKIDINNTYGNIPDLTAVKISDGGSGYDNRVDSNGNFLNAPFIDILGNGFGALDGDGLRKNKSAIMEVSSITNGSIDGVTIVDTGEKGSYKGGITARVRPRAFYEDQIVKNTSNTGSGRVEYYDAKNDELILYDVSGYFLPNDEIVTTTREKARAFIAQSYVTPTTSRNGLEVKGETQNIEFPKEYTFKTSNSSSNEKTILKCRILEGYTLTNNTLPKVVTLRQNSDKIFGVNGVDIEVDDNIRLSGDVFLFDVSTNKDVNKIYLPGSSVITKNISNITDSSSNFVVTVDDATKFPVTNGIIHVSGKEIFYKTRTVNQFFGCEYLTDIGQSSKRSFSLGVKDKVVSLARLRYNVKWTTSTRYFIGDYVYHNNNVYYAKNTGISGSTAPTHTEGFKYDGLDDSVQWQYAGKNRLDHTLQSGGVKFEILGLPGSVVVETSGSLYSSNKFNFTKYDSPNVKAYNFTTSEISDRLSLILGTNYNWTRKSVLEESGDNSQTINNIKSLPSYESLIGFNTQYDYEDYIYVAGSGIPRWWKDIVNLNTASLSSSDAKKVAFKNQKLVTRWKKSGLISDTQAIGIGRKTKKLIGLNLDAIQVNSYKGNTISEGYIQKFFIGNNGGEYPVVYSEDGNGFGYTTDFSKFPKISLSDGSNLSNTNNFIRISASVKSINFNKLAEVWTSTTNLTGFTSKPKIEVINNNPIKKLDFTSFTPVSTATSRLEFTNHGLETSDRVTFTSPSNYFKNIKNNDILFVNKFNNNEFSLHRTKSDALLGSNKVNLSFNNITSPKYTITSDQINPLNFEEAVLDLSYKNGVIDNILIVNSGKGYIELPTIRISDGGKVQGNDTWYVDVPFSKNSERLVDFAGPLVSYYNFDKENFNELSARVLNTDNSVKTPGFTEHTVSYTTVPTATFNFGVNAKATASTSNGSIVSLSIVDNGTNYTIPPIVKISGGGGKDAAVTSIINSSGNVSGFKILNGGSGYVTEPKVEIISAETIKASVSPKLREWTFNLVRELNALGRLDSYGGYVYDDGDEKPYSGSSKSSYKLISYENDFPKDIDKKQYYLIQNTDKLLARYILEKAPLGYADSVATALGTTKDNLTQQQILDNFNLHSPAITVSYDGIPVYGSRRILKQRNVPLITDITNSGYSAQFDEAKSMYRLKYDVVTSGTAGRTQVNYTDNDGNAQTAYVLISRPGGPSITDFPIGTFIEDYFYDESSATDDSLDKHNGRFSITPEFPTGRYCYFATTKSFDPITDQIIADSGISFKGFPYFIGDEFASEYDDYMNTRCRTNDRIPSFFKRSFEKDIDDIPGLFPGLIHNDEYPSEDDGSTRTVANLTSVSPGSVDSVIIENKGDNYRVGDRLVSNNERTFGSGFDAIVSKVGGKEIRKVELSNDGLETTFTTNKEHGLAINDFVYINYIQPSYSLLINLHNNFLSNPVSTSKISELGNFVLNPSNGDVSEYNNFTFYKINLNFKYTYQLNIPANSDWKLTYDIDKTNEFFTLEDSPTNTIVLNANKLPNRLYLHIGQKIYEINKTRDYFGIQKVISTEPKKFTIKTIESASGYETENISYTAKSFGALGPIEEVSITGSGSGYRKLPTIEKILKKGSTTEIAGNGKAIIQTNSNTIGTLQKLEYSSVGSSLTSSSTTDYYLNIPATAKIVNNFEIYDVEILTGGKNYEETVTLLVNGVESNAILEATVNLGTISAVKVIDGGFNYSEEPTITVKPSSSTTLTVRGSGATFKAKIRRKSITKGSKLTGNVNSILFPVPIESTVVSFDSISSVLEFDEDAGQFKDGDNIYYGGILYGKIQSIRRTKAYAKVSPITNIIESRTDISGKTSEYLQRLTDSNYYQDWSYSITSSRDTKEWKKSQDENTHPAGFKQFGKKIIERRKFFFKNPLDVFKSNLIFSPKITGKIDSFVKLSPCGKQRLFLPNVAAFNIDSYIVGTESNAKGKVIDKTETSIIIELYDNVNFIIGEIIVPVSQEFVRGTSSATNKLFNFWNGIFQEPGVSYDASSGSSITYVPRYTVGDSDKIIIHEITETVIVDGVAVADKYISLDSQTLPAGQNSISFRLNRVPYVVNSSNLENFIVSIGGVVQNTGSMTASNNSILLGGSASIDSKAFAIVHPKLSKLTFQSSNGNSGTHTITSGQTITNDCQLLIFREGLLQSQLVTNYTRSGNTITLTGGEQIDSDELFGWHFNGTITCSVTDGSTINQNKLLRILNCETTFFRQKIESNAEKRPESLYELRKENISGTVALNGASEITGFDTRFTYTTPRTSESFIEVLDPIDFSGGHTSITLKKNGQNYSPEHGHESLIVMVNNRTLQEGTDYTLATGPHRISFTQAYTSSDKGTILDVHGSYVSKRLNNLQVLQDDTKTTFNLTHDGVPKYVNNISDIFVVRDGLLKIPVNNFVDHRNVTLESHTVNDNKITFLDSPAANENIKLAYFTRQLLPSYTKNVVLDRPSCFTGNISVFPITQLGDLVSPANINNLFVIRNGVVQKPSTDFTISGDKLTFTTAPSHDETIEVFYSYDGLNQNIMLDNLTGINGSTTTHQLTNSGTAFTSASAAHELFVVRNGVVQNPTQDYTVSGSQITFTTALQTSESIHIIYVHAATEIGISSSTAVDTTTHEYTLASAAASGDENHYVVYADGVPNLYNKGFTFHNNRSKVRLTHRVGQVPTDVFIVKYTSVTTIDDVIDCPDGVRTRFRLLQSGANLTPSEIVQDADILIVRNGVVLEPGVQYTIGATKKYVDLTSAPAANDEFFFVKMYGNLKKTLTNVSGNIYDLSDTYTDDDDKEDLVVFSNNTWKFRGDGFDFTDNNTIQLTSAHTTGNLFAIRFFGGFNRLDDIHTPFDGSRTKFNLFYNNDNFVAPGTIDNDNIPDSSSLFVCKNNDVLEPGQDYTLVGDIKTQIQFTTAPTSSDVINVSVHGSFTKLDTIASGSGTMFSLTKSSAAYYPNADIERPRDHENQILVFKNGDIQSPIYDYYIDNNKVVFLTAATGERLTFVDYRGTPNDVKVINRLNQLSVGDEVTIPGEDYTRSVTEVRSPTVAIAKQLIPNGKFISGNSYIAHEVKKNQNNVSVGDTFTASGTTHSDVTVALNNTTTLQDRSPTGFAGTVAYSNGEVSNITLTNGGDHYKNPIVIRTKGPGTSAKAIIGAGIGGTLDGTTIDLIYPGENIYVDQTAVATLYASVYKRLPLHKSNIRKSTNLQTSVNTTVETLVVGNVADLPSNSPSITLSGTGGGVPTSFQIYISNGGVRKVEILNGGSGWDDRSIEVEVTGGGGSGCVLEPVLNNSGTITDLIVRNPGTGYDTFKVIAYDRTNNTREVIDYTSVDTSNNTIKGCTRGVAGTSAVSHAANVENPDNPTTGTMIYFDNYL